MNDKTDNREYIKYWAAKTISDLIYKSNSHSLCIVQ